MNRKIIFLFILLFLVIAISAVYSTLFLQNKNIGSLIENKKAETNTSINAFFDLENKSLYTFISDYSARDEVLRFFSKENPGARAPVFSLPLETYKADAAVLFNNNFGVISSLNNYSKDKNNFHPENISFSREEMARDVSKNKVSHTFAVLDKRVVELFVSQVAPAISNQNNISGGYLLIMKVWDNDYVSYIAKMNGAHFLEQRFSNEKDFFIIHKSLLNLEGRQISDIAFQFPVGNIRKDLGKTVLYLSAPIFVSILALFILSGVLILRKKPKPVEVSNSKTEELKQEFISKISKILKHLSLRLRRL